MTQDLYARAEELASHRLTPDGYARMVRALVARGRAAEDFIDKSPGDPDLTIEQHEAYLVWRALVDADKEQP